MSKKVLVATEKAFAKVAVDGIAKVIQDAGYTLSLLENYTDPAELLTAVQDADAMIVRSDMVTAQVLDAAKQLKIVVRAGAGYDNLDLAACTAHNVVAMNTPGQNSNAVAELVFGLMLQLARRKYTGKSGTELRGKKIGIHAFGYVGRYVAEIAKGFGMQVFAFDPYVSDDIMAEHGVTPVKNMEDMYRECDYISLHMPFVKETEKIVNFQLMSIMKDDATIINTARKEIICEEGLKKTLGEKKNFRYGSDITPATADQLMELYADKVFFTAKKMGAQTEEANINAGIAAAKQIVAFLENGDTTFQVNR